MFNEFFGFSENPFEVTHDPRFFYFTSSRQEALSSMVQGIHHRSGLISITGEVGTGKTTLIHLLLERLDEKVKTVLIFYTVSTFEELLRSILVELELEVVKEDRRSLLSQLNEFLAGLDQDETVTVIIDEAQNLCEKVLREIGSHFALNNPISMRLQVIFVGQPEFERRFRSQGVRQLNQRIEIRRQIKALDGKESREYIDHRLKQVGSGISKIFVPEAVSMICGYARGIPRIINILCDNAFLKGYTRSQKEIDPDIIQEVIHDLEGRVPQKPLLSWIHTAVRAICPSTPRSALAFKRTSLVILLSVSLGGLLLVTHESVQRRLAEIWSGKISRNVRSDSERSLTSSFPVEAKWSESPPLVVPPPVSLAPADEGDKVQEIVIIKEGETLSSLAEKFYRMSDATLVARILDFNPEIANADFITVGQEIRIPKIAEEVLVTKAGHAYEINAGTFETPDIAGVYRNEAALKGKQIEIIPRKVSPHCTWYSIVIGKFDNKDEALKMVNLLKEKGLLHSSGVLPK
jgi:general secretion pathway protein A